MILNLINEKNYNYRNDLDTIVMVDLFNRGVGITEIGETLGCAKELVGWRLRKLGYKRTKSESLQIAWVRRRRKLIENRDNPNWKGGRYQDSHGYIRLYYPGHHRCWRNQNYIFEHTLVWEQANNTELPDGYDIHHLNGIKNDNRPDNLVAMKHGEHTGQTIPYKKRILELEEQIKRSKLLISNERI